MKAYFMSWCIKKDHSGNVFISTDDSLDRIRPIDILFPRTDEVSEAATTKKYAICEAVREHFFIWNE